MASAGASGGASARLQQTMMDGLVFGALGADTVHSSEYECEALGAKGDVDSVLLAATMAMHNALTEMVARRIPIKHARSVPAAVKWSRKAAELGDAHGMYLLGCCYDNGWVKWVETPVAERSRLRMPDVPTCEADEPSAEEWGSYPEALEWWRRGADAGDVACEYMVGVCYRYGLNGAPRSAAECTQRFSSAIQQGFTPAVYALAQMAAAGESGTDQGDRDEAFLGYYDGSLVNHGLCLLATADAYLAGWDGQRPDPVAALPCYRRAALARLPPAMHKLGMGHVDPRLLGNLVRKNLPRALEYFCMAAKCTHVPSMFMVARTLELMGQGESPHRLNDILMWYMRAATHHSTDAVTRLEALAVGEVVWTAKVVDAARAAAAARLEDPAAGRRMLADAFSPPATDAESAQLKAYLAERARYGSEAFPGLRSVKQTSDLPLKYRGHLLPTDLRLAVVLELLKRGDARARELGERLAADPLVGAKDDHEVPIEDTELPYIMVPFPVRHYANRFMQCAEGMGVSRLYVKRESPLRCTDFGVVYSGRFRMQEVDLLEITTATILGMDDRLAMLVTIRTIRALGDGLGSRRAVLGFSPGPGGFWVMLEPARDGTVWDYITRRPALTLVERLPLIVDAARALLQLQVTVHSQQYEGDEPFCVGRIWARGLQYAAPKAVNASVAAGYVVKLDDYADFGRFLHSDACARRFLAFRRWRAPEHVRDTAETAQPATAASDVWSFGVYCWEVLAGGALPYGDDIPDDEDVPRLVSSGRVALARPVRCPEPLWAVIRKCLRLEPSRRPTVARLHERLAAYERCARAAMGLPERVPHMMGV